MSTKPFPQRPNLEFDRKQARKLLRDFRSGDAAAIARFAKFHPRFRGKSAEEFTLADAQLVVAREYGVASWSKLKDRIEGEEEAAKVPAELIERFRIVVNAKDAKALDELLGAHPELQGVIDRPMFEAEQPAIVAVRTDRAMVDVLLAHGADINARSQFSAHSVGVLDEQNPEMAAYLISRGAVSELAGFSQAVANGNVDEVERLLKDSPALREQIDRPLYPFGGRATRYGVKNRKLMEVLLHYGADINLKSDWWAGGFGVFDEAADDGTVEYLISRGGIVDVFAAAKHKRFDRLKELIEAEPSLVHAKGGDGKRPLHYAATREMIDYLLEHGAEVDARCVDHNSTAAQYAVGELPWKTKYLLERGAEPDVFMAAALGDIPLLEKILKADPRAIEAHVAKPGYVPVPPMHIYEWVLGAGLSVHQVARKFGHPETADSLAARSDPKLRFLDACSTGNEAVARRVLKENPSLMSQLSHMDHLLLPEAAFNHQTAAVKLMLDLGFPVDEYDEREKFTALNRAAIRGYADVVELLLSRGANPNHIHGYGGNGLGTCLWGSLNFRQREGDYPETARLLIEAGAKMPEQSFGTPECQAVLEQFRGKQ